MPKIAHFLGAVEALTCSSMCLIYARLLVCGDHPIFCDKFHFGAQVTVLAYQGVGACMARVSDLMHAIVSTDGLAWLAMYVTVLIGTAFGARKVSLLTIGSFL